jgi:polyisoprenoid-binding protein YceI
MKKLMIAIFLIGSILVSGEYHVQKDAANKVEFRSKAPMEEVVGVTSNIDGYLYWDGDQFTDSSALYFEVDLNTIDTGIGLRNRHMRENYLETDQYPLASFEGRIIDQQKVSDNGYEVTVEGKMSIHGVEKNISIAGKVTQTSATTYQLHTAYSVLLTDYNIDIPKLMFLKLDNEIKLDIRFTVAKAEE